MNTNKVEVSPELLERGKSVREYVAATNAVIKELTDRARDVLKMHYRTQNSGKEKGECG